MKWRAAAPTTTRFSFHLGAFLPPPRNKAIKSSSFFQIKQEEGKTKSISRRQKRFLLVVGEDQWSVSDHIKDGAVKNLPQT